MICYLQKGAGGAGRVPVSSRPVGFGNNLDATVDIPLDTVNVRTLVLQDSCTFSLEFISLKCLCDWCRTLQRNRESFLIGKRNLGGEKWLVSMISIG